MDYAVGQVLAFTEHFRPDFVTVEEVKSQENQVFVGMSRLSVSRRKFFRSYTGRYSESLKGQVVPLLVSPPKHRSPKRISLFPKDLFGHRIRVGLYVYVSTHKGVILGKVTKVSLLNLKTILSFQSPPHGYYRYEVQPLDSGETWSFATCERILVMNQSVVKEVEGLPLDWKATVIGFPNGKFSYDF